MPDAAPDPSVDSVASVHQALVDQLCQAGLHHSPAVEAAFRALPRHLFLPGVPLEQVYRDRHVVTKRLDLLVNNAWGATLDRHDEYNLPFLLR